MQPTLATRASGLLLHVTSLPGPFGIGDLGPAAYHFIDVLQAAQQRVWQVLPLVPVGHGNSPYSSPSTFAGNPLLLSPELLTDEGLLPAEALDDRPGFPEGHVDYPAVIAFKRWLLEQAFARYRAEASAELAGAFQSYCEAEAEWLDDYALFMALKDAHGSGSWTSWPGALCSYRPDALAAARAAHAEAVRLHQFGQFLFDRQWRRLRAYARERGVQIMGDLPIYVAHDSADVWGQQELFALDEAGRPTVVAGVPPDYFSATGQRWGNPLYRWDLMQANDYTWWTRRLARCFDLFDLLRLDHFRGFEAYWEIPAEEPTAVGGRWRPGPGADLFERVRERLGSLPIVAEDLGLITPEVTALMRRLGFPGMAVLQFAFGADAANSYLPHNYRRALVAYLGTHDNDTFTSWWTQGATDAERAHLIDYLGPHAADRPLATALRALMGSVADLVITPVQDVLRLGGRARMNTPGEGEGNWGWRLLDGQLTSESAGHLRHLTDLYGRAPGPARP